MLAVLLAAAVGAPSAWADVPVRTLLLSQQIRTGAAPRSSPYATALVARPGESEGFQIALRAPGRRLDIAPGSANDPLCAEHARFLEIGFVKITRPSGGTRARRGLYEDPLPPYRSARGVRTARGSWSGFVVLVDVPSDASSGTASCSVVVSSDGAPVATVAFTLRVAALAPIARESGNRFRMIFPFTKGYYTRIAHVRDKDDWAKQHIRQGVNLISFVERHHASLLDWPFAAPSRSGHYGELDSKGRGWYTAGGPFARAYHDLSVAVHDFPRKGYGFDPFEVGSDGQAGRWLSTVRSLHARRGWLKNAYVYAMSEPTSGEVPKVARFAQRIHRYAPGVKVVMPVSPAAAGRRLYDGGSDDVDIWFFPHQQWYGSHSDPRRFRKVTAAIRKRGHQVWTYSFYAGTSLPPNVLIDSPATDRHLLVLWNALEGSNGWLHWQLARWISPFDETRPRDPYRKPLSYVDWTHSRKPANGEASLIYPPVARQYGLRDPAAEPVTSLRFEQLGQAAQWADTLIEYRNRFGAGALARLMRPVVDDRHLSSEYGMAWPAHRNGGLADRMEKVRRAAVQQLEAAG